MTTNHIVAGFPDGEKHFNRQNFNPDLIESRKVLVIGNGPSAITLSFILSGRWPYYSFSKEPHPIEFLHEKLASYSSSNCSLLEFDLESLSKGLSGRSLNPVSVLFDQLQNPNTDFGHSQESTLKWRYHPEKSIDHIILGTGLPGGMWYNMRKSKTILTVSRQKWMQLPELEMILHDDQQEQLNKDYGRISFYSVAQYYRKYVDHFGLGKYFRNYTRVTKVEWCHALDCWIVDAVTTIPIKSKNKGENSNSSSSILCQSNSKCSPMKYLKCSGRLRNCKHEVKNTCSIRFLAKYVVLATGTNSSTPSTLNVPGERSSFVLHSLHQLKEELFKSSLPRKAMIYSPLSNLVSSAPIALIIGSGLSAADALFMLQQQQKFRVIHIFRRSIQDRSLIFNQLSNENLYPEYAQTFRRMKSTIKSPLCVNCFVHNSCAPYQAYHRCTLSHLSSMPIQSAALNFQQHSNSDYVSNGESNHLCNQCKFPLWKSTITATIPVSLVIVLIGSKPSLDFLSPTLVAKLGLIPNSPIDIRKNPIGIDPITYESQAIPQLYAIGPLVGDNFVRFLQGGAFAVAANLMAKNQTKPHTNESTGPMAINDD